MYCMNCGTQISEGTRFCRNCGSEIHQASPSTFPVASQQGASSSTFPVASQQGASSSAPHAASLQGFSSRISDPAFAKYIKNTNRWAAIFSLILAAAAVIGFYIAGEAGAEGMSNPQSLYIGFGIGGMFLVIALFQILGRKRSTTWDGAVVDKKIKRKTEKQTYGNDEVRYEDYLEYSVIIQSDRGKRYTIRNRNDDTLYNYYRIGDRVRHHAGLNSYEKYDKTGDTFIPCNACATLCDINADYCFRCKCPLLK